MKKLILLLLLGQFAYATEAKDIKNKAGETAEVAMEYTKEQKEAFIKEMETNILALKDKIKQLRTKATYTKDEKVSVLQKKQDELEADLAKIKKSSGSAWSKLSSGMSKAWSEVKTSLADAKEELKK